jgi:hypothetical protein
MCMLTAHLCGLLIADDRLAEGMDRYHTHFRYEFNRVYNVSPSQRIQTVTDVDSWQMGHFIKKE